MIHHNFYTMRTHKKVQTTRKKEAGIKKQTIIYGRSQERIMFRVKKIILSILFNQVEIDGVTETERKGRW